MNDRLKFRAYNVATKDFVNNVSGISDYSELENDDGKKFSFRAVNNSHRTLYAAQLKTDWILMQCTGLKDKNGKLIYEGDVIEVTCGKFIIQYCDKCKSLQCFSKVSWIKELYCFACEGDYHWFDLLDDLEDCEVIGNIYENPELLEG